MSDGLATQSRRKRAGGGELYYGHPVSLLLDERGTDPAAWDDYSGNGYIAVSDAGQTPTLLPTGKNGLQTRRYQLDDGSWDDSYITNAPSTIWGGGNFSAFFVGQLIGPGAGNRNIIYSHVFSTNFVDFYDRHNAVAVPFANAPVNLARATATGSTNAIGLGWIIYEVKCQGDTLTIWRNGVQIATDTRTRNWGSWTSTLPLFQIDGEVGEFAIVTGTISNAASENIRQNLATKWAIT